MNAKELYWPVEGDEYICEIINEHVCEAVKWAWEDVVVWIDTDDGNVSLAVGGPENPDNARNIFCPKFNLLDEIIDFAESCIPSKKEHLEDKETQIFLHQQANLLKNLSEKVLDLSIMLEKAARGEVND
jgi:hypothetical protein